MKVVANQVIPMTDRLTTYAASLLTDWLAARKGQPYALASVIESTVLTRWLPSTATCGFDPVRTGSSTPVVAGKASAAAHRLAIRLGRNRSATGSAMRFGGSFRTQRPGSGQVMAIHGMERSAHPGTDPVAATDRGPNSQVDAIHTASAASYRPRTRRGSSAPDVTLERRFAGSASRWSAVRRLDDDNTVLAFPSRERIMTPGP